MRVSSGIGFKVHAETGAVRRAVERVEKAALELEQAIEALNAAQIEISVEDTK